MLGLARLCYVWNPIFDTRIDSSTRYFQNHLIVAVAAIFVDDMHINGVGAHISEVGRRSTQICDEGSALTLGLDGRPVASIEF